MNTKSGCLICGADLVYHQSNKIFVCHYCSKEFLTNVNCANNHYVCDACHSSSSMDLIETFCKYSKINDPLVMAIKIMEHPAVHMHGPEHHYLPAAVLISAYYKATGQPELIESALQKARKRAELVPGGFCGSHGGCGAGLATGIFISVITGATPYSKDEWRLTNLITGTSLQRIAKSGGPRCCKRVSYQSILEAVKFVKDELNVSMPCNGISGCRFFKFNKECLFTKCEFFNKAVKGNKIQLNDNSRKCSCCS